MTGKTADGESTSGQELLMEKLFHGSEGYASHVELFFQGKGAFEMAFVRTEIENNVPGNERHASAGYMLELRSQLHCDLCEFSLVTFVLGDLVCALTNISSC